MLRVLDWVSPIELGISRPATVRSYAKLLPICGSSSFWSSSRAYLRLTMPLLALLSAHLACSLLQFWIACASTGLQLDAHIARSAHCGSTPTPGSTSQAQHAKWPLAQRTLRCSPAPRSDSAFPFFFRFASLLRLSLRSQPFPA